MSGDVQLELWLHEYKMEALSAVLEQQGTSVEKQMQEMLMQLYTENVSQEVQRGIRQRIDDEYAAELAEREAARKYSAFQVRESGKAGKTDSISWIRARVSWTLAGSCAGIPSRIRS